MAFTMYSREEVESEVETDSEPESEPEYELDDYDMIEYLFCHVYDFDTIKNKIDTEEKKELVRKLYNIIR